MHQKLKSLSKELAGDLFYDKMIRTLYATDASSYREMPLAVAIPKSKEDIEKMKSEAEANAEEDKKIREEVEVMNQADSLVFQIEKSIKEFDEKITIDQKEKVVDNLTELKDRIANRDIQKVKVVMETLQTTFNEIMQSVYSQTTEQPQDDGMDVEFEEVKTEE